MTFGKARTMRAVRFRDHGEPSSVLALETIPVPTVGPGEIRIRVRACGLAPADWALCRGLFAGRLPRGIGIDVSGTVEAVGEGVTDVCVGDPVLGAADWANCDSAGASDYAIMTRWAPVPDGLDIVEAAGMTMAIDTAAHHLAWLGLTARQTILINGAGTTIGFAAVQMALLKGARVIATAGETYAQRLRDLGAQVTSYADGLAARVASISSGTVDLVLDTAPPSGVLPSMVEVAGGDPKRVMTISDFDDAKKLGVRHTFGEDISDRTDVLPAFAQLAAEGKFTIPIARTFPLTEWREAMEISLGGKARGKLLLLP